MNIKKRKGLIKKVRPARPQAFWRAERTEVREHDKGLRTPLAAFLNSPFRNFWERAEPRPPQEFLQTIGSRGDDR